MVDLADGTIAEAAFPHLASCDACRRQLSELRATIDAVEEFRSAVPEPPPYFWNQFQQRVSEAVATEAGVLARIRSLLRPRMLVPITAAAAVAVVAVIASMVRDTLSHRPAPPESRAAAAPGGGEPTTTSRLELLNDSFDDDPSLQLVADLASGLDLAAASDAGLAPRGSAEHALTHMSPQELQELHRLLRAELGT